MKVLLVRPQKADLALGSEILVRFEPLALEYVGAGVRNNHDVKILDQRVDRETTLEDIMESFQPDIVGMGGCTSEVNPTKKTLAAAKKIHPGVLTVVGGHHATVCPQDLFEDYIDVVAAGHDVGPFKKICDCHEKKKSFEDIENIYYRQNGKMAFNTKKSFAGWQDMPFPDRTLTSQYRDKYLHPFLGPKVQPFACVSSSIGCRFRCKFCAIPKVLDRKVYFREIEDVVRELQAIAEPLVLWVDDEFFLDTERALKLAERIHQAGIEKVHLAMCRSDTIIRHPECIEKWAEVGLKSLLIGFEAHSDKELKRMRKDSSIAKNEEAIRICKANNIHIRGNFIVYPDYSKEDFKELRKYARNLDIELKGFTIMTPFPITDLYEEVKNDLITHNFDLFDNYHTLLPTRLSLKEFYKEFANLIMKSSSILERLKMIRQLDPQIRKKVITVGKNIRSHLKNAYRDY